MGRPGARVSRRKHKTGRVGFSHRVKREETMVSFRNIFLFFLSYSFFFLSFFLTDFSLRSMYRPGSRLASMVSSSVARIRLLSSPLSNLLCKNKPLFTSIPLFDSPTPSFLYLEGGISSLPVESEGRTFFVSRKNMVIKNKKQSLKLLETGERAPFQVCVTRRERNNVLRFDLFNSRTLTTLCLLKLLLLRLRFCESYSFQTREQSESLTKLLTKS